MGTRYFFSYLHNNPYISQELLTFTEAKLLLQGQTGNSRGKIWIQGHSSSYNTVSQWKRWPMWPVWQIPTSPGFVVCQSPSPLDLKRKQPCSILWHFRKNFFCPTRWDKDFNSDQKIYLWVRVRLTLSLTEQKQMPHLFLFIEKPMCLLISSSQKWGGWVIWQLCLSHRLCLLASERQESQYVQ